MFYGPSPEGVERGDEAYDREVTACASMSH